MGGRRRYVSISLLRSVSDAVDKLMDELEYWPSRAEFLREAALEKIRIERRAWINRSKETCEMSEEEKKKEEVEEEEPEEEVEEEEEPEEE